MTSHLLVSDTSNTTPTQILFVHHRLNNIGGIETRWIDEFHYLNKNNYQVYLLTNKNNFDPNTAKLFETCQFITIDIDSPSLVTDFIILVDSIIETIENHKIQVISIHMLDLFACAAVMAAQICSIPIISTIHGPLDIYRTPLNRLFIQQLAGRSFSICIQVSKILQSISPARQGITAIIPNLINLEKYRYETSELEPAWLMISRISPEKHISILRFLQAADECQISRVDIAGGGNNSEIRKSIKSLNIKTQVKFLGEIKDVQLLIPKYIGVAGMARVALEGLSCKKPVCIIAFDGSLIGLVNNKNFQRLKDYNFTGEGFAPISNQKFLEQIQSHTHRDTEHIYQRLESELCTDNWNEYIKIYNKATFIDNKALESLYHKIVYFSATLSRPFEKDNFFFHLLHETLIEYDLSDIQKMWEYYEESLGLLTPYPNPYNITNKSKRIWWKKIK